MTKRIRPEDRVAPPPCPHSPETLWAYYRDNDVTLAQVAEHFDIAVSTVHRHLRTIEGFQAFTTARRSAKLSAQITFDPVAAWATFLATESLTETAKVYNVTDGAMWQALRKRFPYDQKQAEIEARAAADTAAAWRVYQNSALSLADLEAHFPHRARDFFARRFKAIPEYKAIAKERSKTGPANLRSFITTKPDVWAQQNATLGAANKARIAANPDAHRQRTENAAKINKVRMNAIHADPTHERHGRWKTAFAAKRGAHFMDDVTPDQQAEILRRFRQGESTNQMKGYGPSPGGIRHWLRRTLGDEEYTRLLLNGRELRRRALGGSPTTTKFTRPGEVDNRKSKGPSSRHMARKTSFYRPE